MSFRFARLGSGSAQRWAAIVSLAGIAVFTGGCPSLFPGGNPPDNTNTNTNDNTGGTDEAVIISPTTSFGLSSVDPPVSVLYSVPAEATGVTGFFVPVGDSSPNSPAIGDRVVAALSLPAGERKAFSFDPQEAGVGFFRVGVIFTLDGVVDDVESRAVIQVQGSPNPVFFAPVESITELEIGTPVQVTYDCQDPEGVVQWRLFLLAATDSRANPPDQLGTQLALGSGNVGTVTVDTSDLVVGDYQLGLSATDSGSSIAVTVANGEVDRIITIPNDTRGAPVLRMLDPSQTLPPTIAITAPGATDIGLYKADTFTIRFAGQVREADAVGTIDVFYDQDSNPGTGFTLIAADLPVTATSIAFPSGLTEGAYYVGATIRDGINEPQTVYATGRILVVQTVTLSVTSPSSSLPITLGSSARVAWTTNAPAGSGTVEVFAQTVDAGGNPFGAEIGILSDGVITTTSALFTRTTPGLFEVTVRLTLKDNVTVQAAAPARVRFSSLPAILWAGSLADADSGVDGAVFGGVNFEDNAGTSFTPVGDLNGDGLGELVIAARYGKPFFTNPTGVGPGEAYLVYGASGARRLRGEFNLNTASSADFRMVTFAGIRTPQSSNETDGMSSVSRIPDVDGDSRDELVFGFPDTESRGHNISPVQDGVVDPRSLATLEREDQFLRGGIVFVSSRNSLLRTPGVGSPSITLDLVGQDFLRTCVDPEPDTDDGDFYVDAFNEITDTPPCEGSCADPNGGGGIDATTYIDFGFVSALARDYFWTYAYSFNVFRGTKFCASVEPFLDNACLALRPLEFCAPFVASCAPFSPGLHANAPDPDGDLTSTRHSGFYLHQFAVEGVPDPFRNTPAEPLGARVIGVGLGDHFGTSLTLSNASSTGPGDIVVTAPARTARGILLGPGGGPEGGGEIDGLESGGTGKTNNDAGVAYVFDLRSLWTDDESGRVPPKPHQYVVGEASHCGGPAALIPNIDAVRIAGLPDDRIANIVGISDFNRDRVNDLAIGAPNANGGQGRVYIGYRRSVLEGDYVLEKLALDPADPERLNGLLVVTNALDAFGASLASGFDFNKDEIPDLVIGSPTAAGGAGEVVILFGGTGIGSPLDGITVDTLLTSTRTATGAPVAARIRGNPLDTNGQFGFNVANAGDLDGDKLDDLVIAAPNASPRFDANPNDGIDALTTAGIDLDFDGVRDLVPGADELTEAGLVYVIFGNNRFDQIKTCQNTDISCSTSADCATGVSCVAGNFTINVSQLGKAQLRGLMIAGRHAGDHLGGGDAGDTTQGGIAGKTGRGRSQGLRSAGDVDGDGLKDLLIGSILADPRRDANTNVGLQNGGEAYLIYGSTIP